MRGQIVVYSISGCPHCTAAKSLLKENSLVFVDVGLDKYPDSVRNWVLERTGKTSVPQIFFNRRHVGGNRELQDAFKDEATRQTLIQQLEAQQDDEEEPLLPHPGDALDSNSITEFVCEKDKHLVSLNKAWQAGIFKNHKAGFFDCFGVESSVSGSELVAWLVKEEGVTADEATDILNQIISKKFLVSARPTASDGTLLSSLYKYGLASERGLNSDYAADCVEQPAGLIAQHIRRLTLQLYAQFLAEDGGSVDYKGMATSPLWDKFKELVGQLQRVNPNNLTSDHRKAFFINIYNVLAIHGFVERGAPSTLRQRYKFFSSVNYIIGGTSYTLNDIENGILRRNRASMATLYMKPFSGGDPRMSVAPDQVDPRIHFALNCGAKSCPPIKTFTGEEVDSQLNLATMAFLENDDAVEINTEGRQVRLSQLFKWYAEDFGENMEAILRFVATKLTGQRKEDLTQLIESGNYSVSYLPYDWTHNEKK